MSLSLTIAEMSLSTFELLMEGKTDDSFASVPLVFACARKRKDKK